MQKGMQKVHVKNPTFGVFHRQNNKINKLD